MARRLRHVLNDHLHTSQFFGVPGNSILEAASLVRDAIAYSESSGSPLCVPTLGFQHTFDRISHHCLFQTLHRYGISEWFIERLQTYRKTPRPQFKFTGLWRGPYPSQVQCGMVSMKYDTIYTLPAPSSTHTRRQPTGHQTRPKYTESSSRRVR